MNKVLLTIFLGFVISTSFAYQSAYAGGSSYTEGPVTIDPVRSFDPLVVYWNDNITVTRDTSDDCGGAEPISVKLILGPYSDGDAFDEFGEGGEECEECIGDASIDFEIFDFEILPAAYAGIGGGGSSTPTMIPMTMISPNMYEASFTLHPEHGFGPIEFEVICPGPVTVNPTGPSIFVDPSGRILDCNTGEPIPDAVATLLDDIDNPGVFEVTPEDEGLFINPHLPFPTNPQPVNPIDGSYAWFVIESGPSVPSPQIFWQVEASADGYISQIAPSPVTGFAIPPEVTGLDFFLQPEDGTCPAIGGNIIPIDSTSLALAGIQSSAMWFLPIAFVGAGFAVFKLRKYWN